MSSTAIKVDGLSKQYFIGHKIGEPYSTLRDEMSRRALAIARSLVKPFAGLNAAPVIQAQETFWALRDIGFDVQEGERLGVIGSNGAGKSTLLKILSRITAPTSGRVTISGRAASLLEVGTGFHPELSGRENIYLNGAVLGMRRAEIHRRFDEIVAFSEVESFIDVPVKRFSSGMYVRLAFAVAAHLEPEILIVDEVLAVGDNQFQRKCLGKMREIGQSGRTIIFVSHNMNAISTLCSKALWLDHGHLKAIGAARDIVHRYLDHGVPMVSAWAPPLCSNALFSYERIEVTSATAVASEADFPADEPLHITFRYTISGPLPAGRLAFTILNQEGLVILASASTDGIPASSERWAPGKWTDRCIVPAHLLAPGTYYLSVSEPRAEGDAIHERVISFCISTLGSLAARDGRAGVIAPLLTWAREGNPSC